MIRALLLRGLLAGLVAGLIAGAFAFALGEGDVDEAIRIEESSAVSSSGSLRDLTASSVGPSATGATTPVAALPGPVLADAGHGGEVSVSRPVQKGGLVLASGLYGLGLGLVFAVAFILVAGRLGPGRPARLALALAVGVFVCVFLPAALKYPPNPPAVGDPDTIGQRTWTYLAMLASGALALWAGARAARAVRTPEPALRLVAGGLVAVATIALAWILLPGAPVAIPDGVPAALIWDFRVVSIGTQAVLWTSLGAVFAVLSQRAGAGATVGVRRAAAPAPPTSDTVTA